MLLVLFALLLLSQSTFAILYGKEANHDLEECICCKDNDAACLEFKGPGKSLIGPTNVTHQHKIFETMKRELHNEPLKIQGKFPAWAAGSLYKNGFGKYESEKAQYEFLSVFDAMGYAMRVTIKPNGSVECTAKFTKNDWYNRSEGLAGYNPHNPPYRSFMGTNPDLGFFAKMRLMFTIVPDNLNVNIVRQGERMFGISDMDGFAEIDRNTMEYLDYFRYSDWLSMTTSILSMMGIMTSAHPIVTASAPHIVYNYVAYPGAYLYKVMIVPGAITGSALFASYYMFVASTKALPSAASRKMPRSFFMAILILIWASMLRFAFMAMDGYIDGVEVNKYTLYKIDTTKEPLVRVPVVSFSTKRLSFLHEMAITNNYILFFEWPTFWSIQSITNPFFGDPARLALSWIPEYGTQVTVVDLRTGKIVSKHYDLGAYWSYHHINAYENLQGQVVVDACTFDNAEHLHTFELRTLKENKYFIPKNVNRRFIVPVGHPERKIQVKNVGPIGFDLPTRNMERAGKSYKFAFGTGHRKQGEWWNCITKVNMDTGKTVIWFEEGSWPSQPAFVPNPERNSEDQGLLMVLMAHGPSDRSYLLALDAQTMEEVARAWIPVILPYTSHGYWDVEMGGNKDATIIPGVKNNWKPKE